MNKTKGLIRAVIFRTAVHNKVADFIRYLDQLPRGIAVSTEEAKAVMNTPLARVPNWLAGAVRAGALVSMPTTTGYWYQLALDVGISSNRIFLSVTRAMEDAFDDAEFEAPPVHAWTRAADCELPPDLGPTSVFDLAGRL